MVPVAASRPLGESLGLFSGAGVQLDAVSFGSQSVNVSQGRFPDGTGAIISLGPTPGTANAPAAADANRPAAAEYQKILDDWKAVLKDLRKLKLQYQSAALADQGCETRGQPLEHRAETCGVGDVGKLPSGRSCSAEADVGSERSGEEIRPLPQPGTGATPARPCNEKS